MLCELSQLSQPIRSLCYSVYEAAINNRRVWITTPSHDATHVSSTPSGRGAEGPRFRARLMLNVYAAQHAMPIEGPGTLRSETSDRS